MLARLNLLRSPRSAAIAPVIRTSRPALAAPFARSPLSRQLHLSRPLLGPSIASPSEYSRPTQCPSCHEPLPGTITPVCSSCSALLPAIPQLFWRPSKATKFDLFDLPRRYDIDQEKLKVEYSHLKEKLDHAEFASQWERQQWSSRVDSAYRTLHSDLERALYLLELLGVDLREEGLAEYLTSIELGSEICEVADALDATTNAEEVAAIRKTSSDRFNETVASLAPAFAATLASDAHDVQPLCDLVLRLQHLYNVEQVCGFPELLAHKEGSLFYLYPEHVVGAWHRIK
ncbi:hypothetical protein JCM5296_005772 [Sporobolomyces johnsonii]